MNVFNARYIWRCKEAIRFPNRECYGWFYSRIGGSDVKNYCYCTICGKYTHHEIEENKYYTGPDHQIIEVKDEEEINMK